MQGHPVGAPTAVFLLEQTLGHITHASNLRALIPQIGGVEPVFVPVAFETSRPHLPVWSNWTVRAGARAAWSVARLRRSVRPDVMFVHTQVPAVLPSLWMRRTPMVVSLDATPEQYDEMGEFYQHGRGPDSVERVKHWLNRRCFRSAAHIVTWSEWARQDLISRYGIVPERVTVIPPGVDVDAWQRPQQAASNGDGIVRILFVGTDLRRKGGDVLVSATRALRHDPSLPEIELHLVTNAAVDPEPGIVVHRGLSANSAALIAEYHRADIFCLPTMGDCLPMVLAEAAAAGLPLVSTDVGAIHEVVEPGVTGELVPKQNAEALACSLRPLVADAGLRRRYGDAARRLAVQDHDARANATRIIEILLASRRNQGNDRRGGHS